MRRQRVRLAVLLALALGVLWQVNVIPSGTAEAAPASFCLPPLVACAPTTTATEAGVNVDGFAFPDNPVGKPVRGLLQAHDHLWSYQGFGQGPFCGKTFDPGGVSKAMVDCPEHSPLGMPAWFEQLSSGQLPLTPHDTTGWPTFKDWPKPSSPTHNQTYYKGLERQWKAGTRVFVDNMVTNRGLCLLYTTKRTGCDEMDNIRTQIQTAHEFQAFLDNKYGGKGKGWYQIVSSPAHARKVIAEGKMAVILGIETSEPFGCSRKFDRPQCTKADIDNGLQEVYDLGVRSMYLCAKYDNALCGVRFDSGPTGMVVNLGNFLTTGKFWQAETCTGPRHDNTIAVADPAELTTLLSSVISLLHPITLPVYPAGPHCNKLGLSDLGEYAIKGMMKRGMIVEPDHMSVKAADQALDVLEEYNYPGVISAHNWMDAGYVPRLQKLGGLVTGIALKGEEFLQKWRETKATAGPDFAFGFGNDFNGLHSGLPRPGDSQKITYPYKSFDGKATLSKAVWGKRTWDFNADGLAHAGLVPDWLEALRRQAGADGPQFVRDMTRGAEAYLRMWEGARR